MKYKAVIFDLFGTLVDIYTQESYYSVLSEMISILKAPKDDFIKLWHGTAERRTTGQFKSLEENLEHICKELDVTVTRRQLDLAKWVRFDYVALALTPSPGSLETLSQIKNAGLKIGLVSNCSSAPPVIWPHTSFAPFFDITVFSSVVGLQKPDPRIYRLAYEQLGVNANDCLYVGDGDDEELKGAATTGMHPVLIQSANEKGDTEIRSAKIDDYPCPKITALQQVLNLLK
ncbi:MAG: HAD family hydrolase [Dehalococcoidales bacterium]|nr:HAD family hydrolase [Dehalococcoidales bacterium]